MSAFWIFVLIVMLIIIFVYIASKYKKVPDLWHINLEKETLENKDWRKVLTTEEGLQVVAMSTPVGESLGWEVHNGNDQFFRVEKGTAELSTAQCVDGKATGDVTTITLTDGMSAVVPRGVCHNVVNKGQDPLQMYTIYGPKHHPPGTVDHTHKDEIARGG